MRAPYHITSTMLPKIPTMMNEISPARRRALFKTTVRKLSRPAA
jgi:hypothetical protein